MKDKMEKLKKTSKLMRVSQFLLLGLKLFIDESEPLTAIVVVGLDNFTYRNFQE